MKTVGEKGRKVTLAHHILGLGQIIIKCTFIEGLRFSEILERVQASEEEILRGLEHYECVEVGGGWFILDQDYQMVVLSRILK